MSKMVICNKRHVCDNPVCIHARPHEAKGAGCDKGIGGVPAICHPTGILSICTEIVDGKYVEHGFRWCKCKECGNIHRVATKTYHDVPAQEDSDG